MKNLTYSILFSTFLFICCNEDKPLSAATESFSENDLPECKNKDCPTISVEYVKYSGPPEIAFAINEEIDDFIIKSLYWGDMSDPNYAPTVNQAALDFVEKYRHDIAEFPNLPAQFEAEINVSELFRNENLISIEERQYKYTGGAHGYSTVSYTNFNAKTGELLTNEKLFKDFNGFEKLAEEIFRKKFQIPESGNINSTKFWFENDQFYIPYTVGVTQNNILIHYNQYDIASYADGPIDVEVPKEKAQQYLAYK